MNDPLVSVIVPCYKQAHFLPETLNSILNQTYNNWECIIVDDGSPDNTVEVANSFASRDRRFKILSQENQGLAMARNNGIAASRGYFILPLDSDDMIDSTYLEKAVDYFKKRPDTKLVYCEADRFGQKEEYWNLPQYNYEDEIWRNCIFCSSVYKRADYDNTVGYNPNMKGGFEDWDFWLSLLKPEDHVYRIPEVLFHYRFSDNSMLMTTAQSKKEFLYRQIYMNHPDIYQDYVKDIVFLKDIIRSQENIINGSRKLINIVQRIKRVIRNIGGGYKMM